MLEFVSEHLRNIIIQEGIGFICWENSEIEKMEILRFSYLEFLRYIYRRNTSLIVNEDFFLLEIMFTCSEGVDL